MWEMAKISISLFLQGKLFAEPQKAYMQMLLGIVLTAFFFLVASFLKAASWQAALISGFIGGMVQPYLFKNLKYR